MSGRGERAAGVLFDRMRFLDATASLHSRTVGCTYRYAVGFETFQAEYVYPEVIRRHSFPVKRINSANLAKVMFRRMGMKLIGG